MATERLSLRIDANLKKSLEEEARRERRSASLLRGRPRIGRPRDRPYDGRPGGLRAGSPPSPPPRSIRPTVRRLPRSPRFSGPGPHRGRSSGLRDERTGLSAPVAERNLFGGLRYQRRGIANLVELFP